jgi:hypothetical protein
VLPALQDLQARRSLYEGGCLLGEGGTPEPKRIAIGLITRKGKLSPATEKFCQCAKGLLALFVSRL